MLENQENELPYLEETQRIFNESYKKFQKFLYKEKTKDKIEFNDIKINGRRLFIDGRQSIDNKILPFWHLVSQGEDDLKFDMYPCENLELKKICVQECELDNENNFLKDIKRVPCIYRASKIQTFIDVIDLYNQNPKDPRLQTWTRQEKDGKHFKIRFIDKHQDIDYIIITKILYTKGKTDISQYRLITAYPVVMKSYKKRFYREYNENRDK